MNINENFNVCKISSIINKIKGLESNSASPTDTWIIYFNDDITYDNKPITSGFLKIFIDPSSNYKATNLALKYEMYIYKYIINNIVKYKLCPNFVKYLGSGNKCVINDLLHILNGNLYDNSGKILLTKQECSTNLKRNLICIESHARDRPSIQTNTLIPISSDFTENFYNILLLENMENNITLNKWLNTNSGNSIELWNIIFQITFACHVMSLSKLVHNDLHSSNIFIKDLGTETFFNYNINENNYVIKTRYQPLIYDFDRGYSKKFGDNKLLNYYQTASQCNIFIYNKDIVKILCYVYKYVSDKHLKNKILRLISINPEYIEQIKNIYEFKYGGDERCFLQYIDEVDNQRKPIPNEWYRNFNDNIDILLNISNNFLPKYSSKLVDINNIFTCNTDYFKPNGELDIEKIITIRKEEEKIISTRKEEEEKYLSDFDLVSNDLSDLSDLSKIVKDDDEESFPPPLSSLKSNLNIEIYKKIEKLLCETNIILNTKLDSGNGSNNQKLDNFIIEFSNKINKLTKIEFNSDTSSQYSIKHYNIFNNLLKTLLKRKKYAFDFNLWKELYYHSIFFYPKINKIGNIPTVLVTKHNHILSFYMKHNIGNINTTFLHFDTHPDMNIVKNSINLPDYNSKYLETKNKNYIYEAENIVWDIGAAISGVILTTGIQNYIWAMPEWIPDNNLKTTYFVHQNKNTINLYSNDPKVEDNDLVDLIYTNRFKNTDKPEKNYIKIQTGKENNSKITTKLLKEFEDTYVLDIDLDYFVCNGQKLKKKSYFEDQYDISSTYRTQTIIFNEDSPRDFYYESEELIKFQNELEKEVSLIKKRINKFLSLINQLKNKGITPSHISICDSTNVEFNLCKKCNSLSNAYVPTNLALIVHYNVINGLKKIFE